MTIIPFACLGAGILLGIKFRKQRFLTAADRISTCALILLMLVIGIGVGGDEEILRRFPEIGLNCIVIAMMAIACSVILTYICEKTILPLEQFDVDSDGSSQNQLAGASEPAGESEPVGTSEPAGISHLVWVMPGSIMIGVVIGFFARQSIQENILDQLLTISLIILYVCVGISQGATEGIVQYLKKLGFRILFLSMAILAGSLIGGILAAMLLDIRPEAAILSAGGMSFYSITGAYMTQAFGIEIGTYGFIVNVLRETFTVLLLPLLIKISPGSAIAGGAAGDMDTMLMPITKFVGARLGFVTLVTGTILTLLVPFLLPILKNVYFIFFV